MVEDEDFKKINLASSQLGFGAAPIDSLPYLNQDIDRQPQVSTPTVTSVSPGTFGGTTTTTITSFKPQTTNGPEITVQVNNRDKTRSYATPYERGVTFMSVLENLKAKNGLTYKRVWYEDIGSYFITGLNGDSGYCTYTKNGEEGWGVSLEPVGKGDVFVWSILGN